MPHRPIDPSRLPPWERAAPKGRGRPLAPAQVEAARQRAAAAGRRYPNLVDNMWAARHVAADSERAESDAGRGSGREDP